jgi:hypothetical protein
MNLIRQVTVAFILCVGFGALCALIGNWTSEQVRHALRRNDPYQRLVLKGDGTPIVIAEPQPPGANKVWMNTAFLAGDEHRIFLGIFDDWHWRQRQFTDPRFPGVVWYFVTDAERHGSAYFAGYDAISKECIGYLGIAGFRAGPLPPSERFPFRGSDRGLNSRLHSLNFPTEAEMPWRVFVQGDNDTIYLVDLAQRTVGIAFTGEHVRSSAILLRSHPPAEAGRRDLVVRTEDAVVVINGRTNEQQRFTIPAELRDTSFSWGQTTTGDQLAVWNSQVTPEAEISSYHVALSNAAGAVTRRSDGEISEPRSPNELRWFLGLNAPAPLLVDCCVGWWLPLRSWYGPHEPYGPALARYMAEYWPSLLIVHILSAILAWLCYRRQKINDASRTERVVWPLFVFLLGLPGWIGYRYTVTLRVAESPAPALRGTEVFA